MRCVEILVVKTEGSAPRETGTRMWLSADAVRGTIGGGNLEYTALKIAREILLSGGAARERRFALGDSLGQCCGGSVTLRFSLTDAMGEDIRSQMHVCLFGAGHVGKEVARILGRLPCTVSWSDPRPQAFPAAVDANVSVLVEEEPAWVVDDAPPGSFFLVMTHSHALDLEIVERVLRRGDFAYLGLIGSETKAVKFRSRLKRKNLAVERLVCPVGLVKAGKHPAEVAVSAVAQLLAVSAAHPAPTAPAPHAPLRSSR